MGTLPVIDCLVLSGGGAKGAYGAGAAKALIAYREKKQIQSKLCFIGASAGALNASILAAGGSSASADKLIEIWLGMSNESVLGYSKNSPKIRASLSWAEKKIRHPFTNAKLSGIYSNEHLRLIIKNNVKFDEITEPLIIAATDYTHGKLKAFCKFKSGDFKKLIEDDEKLNLPDRRLLYWRCLTDSALMENALLASASIPVFFPPVYISALDLKGKEETGWHIDGGVGNNTPTREAAYYLRRMLKLNLIQLGEVYCLKLDTPRVIEENIKEFELLDIFSRTLEIYHRVHTEPIIDAWSQINRNVVKQKNKIDEFINWLKQHGGIDSSNLQMVEKELLKRLSHTSSDVNLIEIEPSSSLGETLEFNHVKIKENIERGYLDMLMALKHCGKIDVVDFNFLKNLPLTT